MKRNGLFTRRGTKAVIACKNRTTCAMYENGKYHTEIICIRRVREAKAFESKRSSRCGNRQGGMAAKKKGGGLFRV